MHIKVWVHIKVAGRTKINFHIKVWATKYCLTDCEFETPASMNPSMRATVLSLPFFFADIGCFGGDDVAEASPPDSSSEPWSSAILSSEHRKKYYEACLIAANALLSPLFYPHFESKQVEKRIFQWNSTPLSRIVLKTSKVQMLLILTVLFS